MEVALRWDHKKPIQRSLDMPRQCLPIGPSCLGTECFGKLHPVQQSSAFAQYQLENLGDCSRLGYHILAKFLRGLSSDIGAVNQR
jgi:hypothetical protein